MRKRMMCTALAVILAVGLMPAAANAAEGELTAASTTNDEASLVTQTTKNLKQRGVKFDLKNGKTYTVKKYYGGLGNSAFSAKLSGLKVKSAKNGTKTATFTVTFKPKKRLTDKQSKKVLAAFKKAYYAQSGTSNSLTSSSVWNQLMDGNLHIYAVDYVTGKCLEAPGNSAGVTYSSSWTYKNEKTYRTTDGWSFSQAGAVSIKVTITFPKSFKNLCVGIGADAFPLAKRTKADASFDGEYSYYTGKKYVSVTPYKSTYWQTSRFKKYKGNYHFMRIS